MKILTTLVICLSLSACGPRVPDIPSVPAAVESGAASAEDVLKASASKGMGILIAASKVANRLSMMEDEAARNNVIPVPADAAFDKAMLAYVAAVTRASSAIERGVLTWDELRGHLNPVLDAVRALSSLVQSLTGIRDQAVQWGETLREIVTSGFEDVFRPAPAGGGVR